MVQGLVRNTAWLGQKQSSKHTGSQQHELDKKADTSGGVIRKRHGQLVGYNLDSIRAKAKDGLQRAMDNLPNFQPEMTGEKLDQFLLDVEHLTRANLAGAYATR